MTAVATGTETETAPADGRQSLEAALGRTERDADAALRAAAAATAALKRLRAAAHVGNLRDLPSTLEAAEKALAALRQQFANTRQGWDFDEEAYFAGTAFQEELQAAAKEIGLRLFQEDDRLYSYPSLIRVLPVERAVLIDKTRERRVRPSVLAAHLKDLQRKPPRFRPDAFLEALYAAYGTIVKAAVAERGAERAGAGMVVRLLDMYNLLTLLPGQSRDYSRQEFARDIYLLDQSGVTTTRDGATVSFPASTGTRVPAATLRIVTQGGQEKLYYGIAFHPAP